MTRSQMNAIRALVRSEIACALAAQRPETKRQPIPCGTGVRGNWPRCMGSAAIGTSGCTCGARLQRLERDVALLIAWLAARGSADKRMREIADEIGQTLGIRQ